MFAMLNGPWPKGTADAADVEALVAEAVTAQVDAGMGLVTDGRVRWPDPFAAVLAAIAGGDLGPGGQLVRAWRAASAAAAAGGGAEAAAVAQALPGPYSLARRLGAAGGVVGETGEAATIRLADALGGELGALADAGCRVVIVEEPAAISIGADPTERALFVEAQARLLASIPGSGAATGLPALHAMLAVTGGSAAGAGPATIFAAPYQSHLFDLIAGPDNWHLVRAAPGDRGIVCAALRVGTGGVVLNQAPELVWAARYAASARNRGTARVGLSNATSLAGLDPRVARDALEALARAARLAEMPLAEAIEAGLDPRAVKTGP